jgi:transposase
LDIAKNVFQVHGIDAAEKVIVRKKLRRGQVMKFFAALPPCLVGIEACATAHHWAGELTKLGHEVRLMPAKDVKAYVKRNRNDAADAEAICEAVDRPTMRFVRAKSAEQQGRLMQYRTKTVETVDWKTRDGSREQRARGFDWDRWENEVASVRFMNCEG